jgi:hypothetical protein
MGGTSVGNTFEVNNVLVRHNLTWYFVRKYNKQFKYIKGHDVIRFVKAEAIKYLGHVEGTSEERMPKRMLKGALLSRRKGRPRTRWLDSVVMNLVVIGLEAGEEE